MRLVSLADDRSGRIHGNGKEVEPAKVADTRSQERSCRAAILSAPVSEVPKPMTMMSPAMAPPPPNQEKTPKPMSTVPSIMSPMVSRLLSDGRDPSIVLCHG